MAFQKGKKDQQAARILMGQHSLVLRSVALVLVVMLQWITPLYALEVRLLTALLLPLEHTSVQAIRSLPLIPRFWDAWNVHQQLEALRMEKEALLREVVMLRTNNDELHSLKATLDAHKEQQVRAVFSPLLQYPRVQVLRGASDGLVTGNPVFSSRGLIGVLGDVAADSSSVQLLTSDELRLPVMHQISKAQGILTAHDGVMTVTFLSLLPLIQPGDVIVTLPTKEGIGAGELIGTVSSVDTKLSDPVTKIRVQSAVFPVTDTQVVIVKGAQ